MDQILASLVLGLVVLGFVAYYCYQAWSFVAPFTQAPDLSNALRHVRIRMVRRDGFVWQRQADYDDFAPLLQQGFEDLGVYGVDTQPGLVARFFLLAEKNAFAVLLDMGQYGGSLNFISFYEDNTGIACTNAPDRGLQQRPGYREVYMPGAKAADLYAKFLEVRPQGSFSRLSRENVVRFYEEVAKEWMAWRFKQGFSLVDFVRSAKS